MENGSKANADLGCAKHIDPTIRVEPEDGEPIACAVFVQRPD